MEPFWQGLFLSHSSISAWRKLVNFNIKKCVISEQCMFYRDKHSESSSLLNFKVEAKNILLKLYYR